MSKILITIRNGKPRHKRFADSLAFGKPLTRAYVDYVLADKSQSLEPDCRDQWLVVTTAAKSPHYGFTDFVLEPAAAARADYVLEEILRLLQDARRDQLER